MAQVVLLKNCTKQIIPINTGDRGVTVHRQEAVQTKSGQVGTKRTKHHVSTSITLMPGEWTRVPGIVLKQRAVQRMLATRPPKLKKQVETGAAADATAPKKTTIEASTPLNTNKDGSAPVVEEGTVAVAEVTSRRRGKKKSKETEA